MFTLQIDKAGNVESTVYTKIEPLKPVGCESLRTGTATAFLHQTASGREIANPAMFEGLADVTSGDALSAAIYPAKRNRNLRIMTADKRFFEFTKSEFEFKADQPDDRARAELDTVPPKVQRTLDTFSFT